MMTVKELAEALIKEIENNDKTFVDAEVRVTLICEGDVAADIEKIYSSATENILHVIVS